MKEKKYYDLPRVQERKNRKKLIRVLRKNGYDDGDLLKIIDAMAGDTPCGKEQTSEDLLNMVAQGAGKEDVTAYAESLCRRTFLSSADD